MLTCWTQGWAQSFGPLVLGMAMVVAPPARAAEAQDTSAIASCLSENASTPIACLSDVLQPCSEHTDARQLRRCFHGLGRVWQKLADAAEHEVLAEAPPRAQLFLILLRDDWRAGTGSNCPATATSALSIMGVRNPKVAAQACEVFHAATWWHELTSGSAGGGTSYQAFQADVESMESCVLETGHVGQEQSCSGLIASGCLEDGGELAICAAYERRVWAAIAQDALGALGTRVVFKDLPSRHRGQHVTGCGSDDGSIHYIRCQMRSIARIASELLLDQEG